MFARKYDISDVDRFTTEIARSHYVFLTSESDILLDLLSLWVTLVGQHADALFTLGASTLHFIDPLLDAPVAILVFARVQSC